MRRPLLRATTATAAWLALALALALAAAPLPAAALSDDTSLTCNFWAMRDSKGGAVPVVIASGDSKSLTWHHDGATAELQCVPAAGATLSDNGGTLPARFPFARGARRHLVRFDLPVAGASGQVDLLVTAEDGQATAPYSFLFSIGAAPSQPHPTAVRFSVAALQYKSPWLVITSPGGQIDLPEESAGLAIEATEYDGRLLVYTPNGDPSANTYQFVEDGNGLTAVGGTVPTDYWDSSTQFQTLYWYWKDDYATVADFILGRAANPEAHFFDAVATVTPQGEQLFTSAAISEATSPLELHFPLLAAGKQAELLITPPKGARILTDGLVCIVRRDYNGVWPVGFALAADQSTSRTCGIRIQAEDPLVPYMQLNVPLILDDSPNDTRFRAELTSDALVNFQRTFDQSSDGQLITVSPEWFSRRLWSVPLFVRFLDLAYGAKPFDMAGGRIYQPAINGLTAGGASVELQFQIVTGPPSSRAQSYAVTFQLERSAQQYTVAIDAADASPASVSEAAGYGPHVITFPFDKADVAVPLALAPQGAKLFEPDPDNAGAWRQVDLSSGSFVRRTPLAGVQVDYKLQVQSADDLNRDELVLRFAVAPNQATDCSLAVNDAGGVLVQTVDSRDSEAQRTVSFAYAKRGASISVVPTLAYGAKLSYTDDAGVTQQKSSGQSCTFALPSVGLQTKTVSFTVTSQEGSQTYPFDLLLRVDGNPDNSWTAKGKVGPAEDQATLDDISSAAATHTVPLAFARHGQTVQYTFALPEGAKLLKPDRTELAGGVLRLTAPAGGKEETTSFLVVSQSGVEREGSIKLSVAANTAITWSVVIKDAAGNDVQTVQSDSSVAENTPYVVPFAWTVAAQSNAKLTWSLAEGATLYELSDATGEFQVAQLTQSALERLVPNHGEAVDYSFKIVAQNGSTSKRFKLQFALAKNQATQWSLALTHTDAQHTPIRDVDWQATEAQRTVSLPFANAGGSISVDLSLSYGAKLTYTDANNVQQQHSDGDEFELPLPGGGGQTTIAFTVTSQEGSQSTEFNLELKVAANADNSWTAVPKVGPANDQAPLVAISSADQTPTATIPFARRGQAVSLNFTLPIGARLLHPNGTELADGVLRVDAPSVGLDQSTVGFKVRAQNGDEASGAILLRVAGNTAVTWRALVTAANGSQLAEIDSAADGATHDFTVDWRWAKQPLTVTFEPAEGAAIERADGVAMTSATVDLLAAPATDSVDSRAYRIVSQSGDERAVFVLRVSVDPSRDVSWSLVVNTAAAPSAELARLADSNATRELTLPYEQADKDLTLSFTLAGTSLLFWKLGDALEALQWDNTVALAAPSSGEALALQIRVESQAGASEAQDAFTLTLRTLQNDDNSWTAEAAVVDQAGAETQHLGLLNSSHADPTLTVAFAQRGQTLQLALTLPPDATLLQADGVTPVTGTVLTLLLSSQGGATGFLAFVVRAQNGAVRESRVAYRITPNDDASWTAVPAIGVGADAATLITINSTDAAHDLSLAYARRNQPLALQFTLPEGATLQDASGSNVSSKLLNVTAPSTGLGQLNVSFAVVAQDGVTRTPGLIRVAVQANDATSWVLLPTAAATDGSALPLAPLDSAATNKTIAVPFAGRGRAVQLRFTLGEGAALLLADGAEVAADADGLAATAATAPARGGDSSTVAFRVRAQSGAVAEFELTLAVEPNADNSWSLVATTGGQRLANVSSTQAEAQISAPYAARNQSLRLSFTLPEAATLEASEGVTLDTADAKALLATLPSAGLGQVTLRFVVVSQSGARRSSELLVRVEPSTELGWSLSATVGAEGDETALGSLSSSLAPEELRLDVPFAHRGKAVTIAFNKLGEGASVRTQAEPTVALADDTYVTSAPAVGGGVATAQLVVYSQAGEVASSKLAIALVVANNTDASWSLVPHVMLRGGNSSVALSPVNSTSDEAARRYFVPFAQRGQQVQLRFELPEGATLHDANGVPQAEPVLSADVPAAAFGQLNFSFSVVAQDGVARTEGGVSFDVQPNEATSWTAVPIVGAGADAVELPELAPVDGAATLTVAFTQRGQPLQLSFSPAEGARVASLNGSAVEDNAASLLLPSAGGASVSLALQVESQADQLVTYALTFRVTPNSDAAWQVAVRANGEGLAALTPESAVASLAPAMAGAPLQLEWTLPEGATWRAGEGVTGQPQISVGASATIVTLAVAAPATTGSQSELAFVVVAQDGSEQSGRVTLAVQPSPANGFSARLTVSSGDFTAPVTADQSDSLRVQLPYTAAQATATLAFTLPYGATWSGDASLTASVTLPARGQTASFPFTVTSQHGAAQAYSIELTVALSSANGYSVVAGVGSFRSGVVSSSDKAHVNLPSAAAGQQVTLNFTLPTGASLQPALATDGTGPLFTRTVTAAAAGSASNFTFTVRAENGVQAAYALLLRVSSSPPYSAPATLGMTLAADSPAELRTSAEAWKKLVNATTGFPSLPGQSLNVSFATEGATPSAARRLLAAGDVRVTLTFIGADSADDSAATSSASLGEQLACTQRPAAEQQACADAVATKYGGQSLFSLPDGIGATLAQAVVPGSISRSSGQDAPLDDDDGGLSSSERNAAIAVPVVVGGVLLLAAVGLFLHRRSAHRSSHKAALAESSTATAHSTELAAVPVAVESDRTADLAHRAGQADAEPVMVHVRIDEPL